MKIRKVKDNTKLEVYLEGRLDTGTSLELEKKLNLDEVNDLIFDFAGLQYLASSGLRVLLSAQKKMNKKNGRMVIRHVNEMIMEVFELTGFSGILTIENED